MSSYQRVFTQGLFGCIRLALWVLGLGTGAYAQGGFSVDGCPGEVCHGRHAFTRADSLRGALTPDRTCYNVLFYDLYLEVDIANKQISGRNRIVLEASTDFQRIQLDLMDFLTIDSVWVDSLPVQFRREGNAFWVDFPRTVARDAHATVTIKYHGPPHVANNPPWDGGFVWKTDRNGKPWVGVACEGFGASSWWPLKDHLSDEPDSMRMTFVVPDTLMAVGNGTLRSTRNMPGNRRAFEWFVHYPINSYNVTLNVADYIHIPDSIQGELGNLALDYYVLRYNEQLARQHFKQVPGMMRCFEAKLGPYPFYKDGYALVETPYWGMEHQGAIAYGNAFRNNDFNFDFIIIHETGHEWFGNNISMADHGDMWIHESFTTYTEFLYLECVKDYATAVRYLKEQRARILNADAIQGPRGVNFGDFQSADMYYKGAWMLHTLRNVLKDDTKWFKMIRKTWDYFRLQTITSEEMIRFVNQELGQDFSYLFRQYLFYAKPPKFEYTLKRKGSGFQLTYRWAAGGDPGFCMPVDYIDRNGVRQRLTPTTTAQTILIQDIESIEAFRLDTDSFYIQVSPLDRME